MGGKVKPLPPVERLQALLICDPIQGTLVWRHRPTEMFLDPRAERAWNTQWAGTEAGNLRGDGYVRIAVDDVSYMRCKLVWAMYHGTSNVPDILDHIDRNPGNDGIANLRATSKAANAKNMKLNRTNTSGVMGVVWDQERGRWQVRIGHKFVGRFDDYAEAVAARHAAEHQHDYDPTHGRP